MAAQEERMTEATTKLLAAVSEAGGGPWGADSGLTEKDLIAWLGVQEDRVDDLKEKLIRRKRELVRLEEVEEDNQVPATDSGLLQIPRRRISRQKYPRLG